MNMNRFLGGMCAFSLIVAPIAAALYVAFYISPWGWLSVPLALVFEMALFYAADKA